MGTNYRCRPQDEELSLSFQQMLDLRAENLERRFQEQEEKRKVEEVLREKAYQKMKAKELAKLRLIREGIMDPPKNEDESGQDIAYAIDKIHRNRLGGWY